MIESLVMLLLFQLIGETLVELTAAPVVGMALLFGALLLSNAVPAPPKVLNGKM